MSKVRVKLARHTFKDRPDWVIVKEDVPIGTQYLAYLPTRWGTIVNTDSGESRRVECVFTVGNGSSGWMVLDTLEIEGELDASSSVIADLDRSRQD